MKEKVVLFILLFTLLSACGASIATETVAVVQDTQTLNPVDTLMPSGTGSSQATSSASQSTIKTPTVMSFLEQTALTATQQALHDKLDKYCIYSGRARGFRFSPNDQWVAVFCRFDTIEIVRIDEARDWEVSSDTLINPYNEYFGDVDHWSNDGVYSYVTFDPHTDGYWEPFHQGIVLYRLNLETGQISEVLPLGKNDWIFYSFAFSPNDRRLAYIVTDKSPVILNTRDMQSGDEDSFEFDSKYNTGGAFVWSPDSQKLIFSVSQFDTSNYDYVATSIVLWEREKLTTTFIIKDYVEVLVPVEWIDQTRVKLQVLFEQDNNYELNLISNELKEITP